MEPTKIKVILTAILLLFGSFMAVIFATNTSVTAYQSTGIAIDFGEKDVTWTDIDLNLHGDPLDALEKACDENDFDLELNDDGTVRRINGISNDTVRNWDLWVVENGSTEWMKLDPPYSSITEYSVASWAYCSEDEEPTVGVDQYGRCIYGYPQANRVVTLSPSLTEMIGALNAVNTLVGTDKYSNYPDSVVEGQNRGDITIVGDYLTPSFELIMKTDPDVVFCDGSQYAHYEMAEKIRKTSVNSVVLYSGASIDTILDNIYIMGIVMGYELRALEVIYQLETAESAVIGSIGSGILQVDTMISLSPDKSPWVSGSGTYFNDVLTNVLGINVFSSRYGWAQVNSESIPNANPSVIIVSTDQYPATQSEYDLLIDSLPEEWKSTDAYKDGNIYVLCDDLAEMAQRSGPRYAQLMELVSLILHSPSSVPKYIGNDYTDYLTITKHLGFN